MAKPGTPPASSSGRESALRALSALLLAGGAAAAALCVPQREAPAAAARGAAAQLARNKKAMMDQELLSRIAVADPDGVETLRENPATVQIEPLPFYGKARLVRVTVELRHRPLEFRYLDDGKALTRLDGTPEAIYRVNEREMLRLRAPAEVVAYLRFFLANADPARPRLVETAGEVRWLENAGYHPGLRQKRDQAATLIRRAKASSSQDGSFEVAATVLSGKTLEEAAFHVTASGHVRPGRKKTLIEDLPVPYTL